MIQSRLSSAIDTAREFITNKAGVVHVDHVLYPLFVQALYPERTAQIESFIELLYQVWLDPSPEHIVFLPDFMQDKFVRLPDFVQVVEHIYSDEHHEKITFLDFMTIHENISPTLITAFAQQIKIQQRQKLFSEGVRIVGIEDAVDHDGPHLVVMTFMQILPAYNGGIHKILIEDEKNLVITPDRPLSCSADVQLPAALPITSIKSLFNDPRLFYERYALNLKPPYQPTHHVSSKALKEFLLFDKPVQPKTVFDQHQITRIKKEFEKFKASLPDDVTWNKEVIHDLPGTKQTLHGTIDLIWDGGIYQLTRRTPPSRNALLNGVEPELPFLAAAYGKPITHVGYIHVKGHLEDVITITRYNDASALTSENIKKLEQIACNNPRSQEKST